MCEWYCLCVESKNIDTNELMPKTESDSQTSRTNLWWALFFFRQGFAVAPARAGGESGETTSPLLTYWGALSLFLIWGEGGGVSGPFGWTAALRWFAQPSGGAECGGHAQYPAFAPISLLLLPIPCFCFQHCVFPPGSSEVAVGFSFFVFCFFVFLYLDFFYIQWVWTNL